MEAPQFGGVFGGVVAVPGCHSGVSGCVRVCSGVVGCVRVCSGVFGVFEHVAAGHGPKIRTRTEISDHSPEIPARNLPWRKGGALDFKQQRGRVGMTPDLKPEAAGSSRVAAQSSVGQQPQRSAGQHSAAQAAQAVQRTEAAQAA